MTIWQARDPCKIEHLVSGSGIRHRFGDLFDTDAVLSAAKNLASCLMFRLCLNSVNPCKSVSRGGTPRLAVYQLVGSDEFAHAPGLGDTASGGVGAIAVKYLRNAAQAGLLS